ncbi:MAG: lipid-A-disaccharide synthase [Hyphomicrobium sp.]
MSGGDGRQTRSPSRALLRVALVAGEHSGDALGARLIAALKQRIGDGAIEFVGVGGDEMAAEGFQSLFPIEDVAVMGPVAILKGLPRIYKRVHQTVDAVIASRPDILVIIDSPEFTHPIAKRVRKRAPDIPIVDYVSPSVWAWRPGRAKKMRAYVDLILALLPFEPEAHVRLGGPACTFVGHPLIEKLHDIRNADSAGLAAKLGLDGDKPVLLVLPGSRRSEVTHLIDVFGETVGRLKAAGVETDVVIPAVRHLRTLIEQRTAAWPVKPHIVDGGDDKYKAMRLARVALAASGTVTLELALAGTPMVVAYRADAFIATLRHLITSPSVVLANLVLGENAFPEILQYDCTADNLAAALRPLIDGGEKRDAQLAALARIPSKFDLHGLSPSLAAADATLGVLGDQPAAGKSRRG